MAYPATCFNDLLGIRGLCVPPATEPLFWLDAIPGFDLKNLSNLAGADSPTGKLTGERLIENATALVLADVQAIYDGHYKVESTLVAGCSLCTFTTGTSTGAELGTLTKNLSGSQFSRLVIDKFVSRVLATGTFHVVIDDGDATNQRVIEHDFVSGVDYEFTNVNYQSKQPSARIYLQESVALAKLSCPSGSGCGCGGRRTTQNLLAYTGTSGGVETQAAYGFLPCAMITCSPDDLLCFLAHSGAPRMIGLALLYKTAELYFETVRKSTRNNKTASGDPEEALEDEKKYAKLYKDKLDGRGTRGLNDLVSTLLGQVGDVCIVCDAKLQTSWATG